MRHQSHGSSINEAQSNSRRMERSSLLANASSLFAFTVFTLALYCALLGTTMPTTAATLPRNNAPTAFVANVGQVRFADGRPATAVQAELEHGNAMWYVHAGGLYIVQNKVHDARSENPTIDQYRLDVQFVGSNPHAQFIVEKPSAGYNTYIIPETGLNGKRAWRASQLLYRDVWPGIDARFTSNGQGVKVDYVVRPGANPSQIVLRYNGAIASVSHSDGSTSFTTPLETIVEQAPVAWLDETSTTVNVSSIVTGTTIRYRVGEYDNTKTLVIDPQIAFATYYGKSPSLSFVKTTVDPDGNVFIGGTTITKDIPVVIGVFQPSLKAKTDAFLGKFTDAGLFLWNTYAGGTGNDYCYDLCADTSGSVWMCGSLDSMNNPLADTNEGYNDLGSGPFGGLTGDTLSFIAGWVMRVTADGAWGDSWVMDGARNDRCTGISFKNNFLAICGETNSQRVSEVIGGAWTKNGANNTQNYDFFIARCSANPLAKNRWRKDWLIYYGGDLEDKPTCVAVDAFGQVACAGVTMSTNISVTDASTLRGGFDAFVVCFATTGGLPDRRWAKYLGGSDPVDYPNDIAMDSNGNPVVVGNTSSNNFPTQAALQGTMKGLSDGFYTKFNGTTGALITSSFFGGNSVDVVNTVSIDKSDRIWLGGTTFGSTDLPVTTDALQTTPNITSEWPQLSDGFLTQISANGATTLFCTYYGAEPQDNLPSPPVPPSLPNWPPSTDFGYDYIEGIQTDGNAYVAVASTVESRRMTTTPNAFMDATTQNTDTTKRVAFLTLVNACPDSTIAIVVNGTDVLCDNDSRQLRGPAGFARYLWSTGERTQNIVVSDSGKYIVTATTADGCRYRDTVSISRAPKPSVSVVDTVSGCLNTLIRIVAKPTGGTEPYSFKWKRIEAGPTFIDNDTSDRPNVNPNTTSHYVVTLTDDRGCTASDTVLVTVINPVTRNAPLTRTFAALDACASSSDDSVWVVNTMDYPITLETALTSNPVFSIVTDLSGGLVIAPKDSVMIVVRATPLAPGTVTGSVTFSGIPCAWSSSSNLSVTKAQLVASLVPSVVDFGTMLNCQATPKDTTVTLRNSGTNDLTLEVGIATAPFTIISPSTPTVLKPTESVQVRVRFDPTVEGNFNSVIKLPFISGTCKDSLRLTCRGKRVSAAIALQPATIDIGALQGCEDSRDTSVLIINSGTTATTVTLPTTTEVVFTPSGSVTIQPGDTLRVSISVRPAASGAFVANLQLVGQPCDTQMPLTITATKSGTSVSSTSDINFGKVYSCNGGPTYSLPVEITYNGTGSGNVSAVSTNPGITTSIAVGTQLPNAVKQTFTVTWTPTADGALVDSIVVTIEPCSMRRVIRLAGVRVTPSLRAVTPTIALGAITADATGTMVFENDGNDTNTVVVNASANTTIVATRPALPATLLPGETLEVDYRTGCVPVIDDSVVVVAGGMCSTSTTTLIKGTCAGAGPATASVVIDSATVNVGDAVKLHLTLTASQNLDENGLTDWEADISYNPMVIVGTGATPDCYVPGQVTPCTITVNGKRTVSTGVLKELDFTAILGTAVRTDVVLERFVWLADTTSPVTKQNGSVSIADICEAGGIRLLAPKAQPITIQAYPVPASSNLTIDVRGLGSQPGRYVLYSYAGELVQNGNLLPDALSNCRTAVDVSLLSTGTYVISIQARGTTYRVPVMITR